MILDSIKLQRSTDMMRSAWMAYDSKDRVLSCGAGCGSPFDQHNANQVARIVCGTQVYDFILAHVRAEAEEGR